MRLEYFIWPLVIFGLKRAFLPLYRLLALTPSPFTTTKSHTTNRPPSAVMGIFDRFTGGGGASADAPMPATAGTTVKTAPVDVRLGFLRKVYILLTINFAITIGISCIFAFIDPVREYILRNSWTVWASIGVVLVSFIVISCFRPPFPFDVIAMYFFVLALSAMVGAIVARYYDAGAGIIVLKAFISTAAIFLTITAYIAVTKKDFNFLYGFLSAGLIALLIIALLTFAFSWVGRVSRLWSFLISVFGALLMTGYILFDTSRIINHMGPDDWLPAVVSIYLDVTNLFLFLLSIFSFVSD